MRERIAILLCCALGAVACHAADKEKQVQELWQNTPLLMRACPAANSVTVNSIGLVPDAAPESSHRICLAEFSSVQLTDDKILLTGKMTEVKPEGDNFMLTPVKSDSFAITADCPRKVVNDRQLAVMDHNLFLHVALVPGTAAPEYYRTMVRSLAGLPPPPRPADAPADMPARGGLNFINAPKIRSDPEPGYSKQGKDQRVEGTVIVRMIVNSDGTTEDPQVVRPLGFGLDEEAVKAVKKWRFDPATRGKKPVRVLIGIEVNFHLY
jgi:TonB family protein